jgi:hypothetical protein
MIMTKPKVPTTKAKTFGQAPKAGRAKPQPSSPLHKGARQRPLHQAASDSASAATNTPRVPFNSQRHIDQPPAATSGDDDTMGERQN